jgi:hypothetical protein
MVLRSIGTTYDGRWRGKRSLRHTSAGNVKSGVPAWFVVNILALIVIILVVGLELVSTVVEDRCPDTSTGLVLWHGRVIERKVMMGVCAERRRIIYVFVV